MMGVESMVGGFRDVEGEGRVGYKFEVVVGKIEGLLTRFD